MTYEERHKLYKRILNACNRRDKHELKEALQELGAVEFIKLHNKIPFDIKYINEILSQ